MWASARENIPCLGAPCFIMKKKCEVEGCKVDQSAKGFCKGFCKRHYERLRRGKNPHALSCYDRSIEERLKARLGPQNPVTGCIEWIGYRNLKGYGQLAAGKKWLTHRIAYELKHGPIPPGMKVCHSCDNPPCCNEEHLFLDTDAGNSADMVTKGRSLKGSKQPNAKLTAADVIEIRRRLATGESQSSIAKAFGVARVTISGIKLGKRWSHLK